MLIEFDPGYGSEPFRSLCRDYPGRDVYSASDFRIEWGPIFHRGRLDGSARLLIIGQDPAQNENIVRRILVGVAGQRTQGLLKKLGLTQSYVLINTFLYSVYGQAGGARHISDPPIIDYRNQWIDAIFKTSSIEAVIALGSLADRAWNAWKKSRINHPQHDLPYAHVTHPTQPESASGGDAAKHSLLTAALLAGWSAAIVSLAPALKHPDISPSGVPYGSTWATDDIVPIPTIDLPAGIPGWMGNRDHWAQRAGATAAQKRGNITITVPADILSPVAPQLTPKATTARITAVDAKRRLLASQVSSLSAISGTVVTMGAPSQVMANQTVYIRDGAIAAVQPADANPPEGFDGISPIKIKGLIFPGLIDLHNHLAYNVLPLWQVPKKFTNRDQWSRLTAYHSLISGPMGVLADLPGMLAALCRYVECKAMFGGATTSQGIALVGHNNIRTFFRGLVRNAESTDDASLPAANARIGDVTAQDLAKFRKTLQAAKSCYLLHLSEGKDAEARKHFLALKGNGNWALSPALAGIHCTALNADDFKIMADHGAAMVWSPMSNLLLYGQTADVAAAKTANVRIALGPDWSPSGSKNLLGELKAARAYSDSSGGLFSDEELVAMATRTAASLLRWDAKVGSVEPGKLADLLVVQGSAKNPYRSLIEAKETDVLLLVIGGIRRYGLPRLMQAAGPELETIEMGGQSRSLNLWPIPPKKLDDNSPQLEQLTLAEATNRLKTALANLGQVTPTAMHFRLMTETMNQGWRLALDEIEDHGMEMRPLAGLPKAVAKRGPTRPLAQKAPIKLKPVQLDPLAVCNDDNFLAALRSEGNLPKGFAAAVSSLYQPTRQQIHKSVAGP